MACCSIQQVEPLRGLRVLLVEDNFLIARALKRLLEGFGCEVVGPYPTLEEGERVAESSDIHGGVLDVNIRGGNSAKIARLLEERGVPFLFISGYSSPPLHDADLLEHTRLSKPIDAKTLHSALLAVFFGDD